jgi:hypothetical protein
MEEKTVSRLTTKQRRAILALLTCKDNTQAAEQTGVTTRTLYRWMKKPIFIDELRAAETQVVDGAIRHLAGLTVKAVASLESVLDNKKTMPSQKLTAANIVLSRFGELREEQELERRLSILEKDINP